MISSNFNIAIYGYGLLYFLVPVKAPKQMDSSQMPKPKRQFLSSLLTCFLLAGTCTLLVLFMINLFSDNGHAAIKLDRMATLNKPIQAKGIKNTGSICFASAVAQMLFRIDGIRNFVLGLDDKIKVPPQELKPLSGLKNLFKSLDDPEIKTVKHHENKFIPSQFQHDEQGDADEFYSAWIEILEKLMGTDLRSELFLQVALNRTRINSNNATAANTSSTISSDFWSSIKVTFPEISIAQNRLIDLETLLSYENGPFGEEIINSNLRLNYKITNLPKFLALSFVRTTFVPSKGLVKINKPVLIPEYLDLSPFLQTNLNATATAKPATNFRLKMFVLHRGTAESGHYVVYVRDTEEIWNLIDDDKVKKVKKIEALESVKLSSICIFKQE